MAKAWTTRPSAKLKALGPDQCRWVCEWYAPAGGRKRDTFGPGDRNKKLAEKFRDWEPKRLSRVVTPDRLTALIGACEAATLPAGLPGVAPAGW